MFERYVQYSDGYTSSVLVVTRQVQAWLHFMDTLLRGHFPFIIFIQSNNWRDCEHDMNMSFNMNLVINMNINMNEHEHEHDHET